MRTIYAANITNPALSPELQSKGGVEFFQDLLPKAIVLAFVIGIVVFFFVFVSGAISWISSGGDKGSIETAKSRIFAAIVGVFILLSVFAILGIIGQVFEINLLEFDIGALRLGS